MSSMLYFCRNHPILVKIKGKRKMHVLKREVTEDRRWEHKEWFNVSSGNLST